MSSPNSHCEPRRNTFELGYSRRASPKSAKGCFQVKTRKIPINCNNCHLEPVLGTIVIPPPPPSSNICIETLQGNKSEAALISNQIFDG